MQFHTTASSQGCTDFNQVPKWHSSIPNSLSRPLWVRSRYSSMANGSTNRAKSVKSCRISSCQPNREANSDWVKIQPRCSFPHLQQTSSGSIPAIAQRRVAFGQPPARTLSPGRDRQKPITLRSRNGSRGSTARVEATRSYRSRAAAMIPLVIALARSAAKETSRYGLRDAYFLRRPARSTFSANAGIME